MFEKAELEIMCFIGFSKVKLWVEDGKLHYTKESLESDEKDKTSDIPLKDFSDKIEALNISGWKKRYEPDGVMFMDGTSWKVKYETADDKPVKCSGENAFPNNWDEFITVLKSAVGEFDTFDD